MAEPQKQQNQTPPDRAPSPPPDRLVPVAKVTFRNGESIPIPGKTASGGTNGVTAKEPTQSEYHSILLDERRRVIWILHFKAGGDLNRKPDGWIEVDCSVCYWQRKTMGASS